MGKFRESGQPFFMWHNFWGPHGPFYSPQAFYDLYRDIEIPEWPTYRWPAREISGPHQVKLYPNAEQLVWEDWAEAIRHYYAFTSLIDQQIGRMLDYLEESGLVDNTIVIFTADHGQTLGSHGGLTDKGWHHFEEIQRIPLIVRLPKQCGEARKTGEVLREWVSTTDVYPSILDMAGADFAETDIHGRSFVPLLRGNPVEWRDTVFIEFNGVNSLATSMVTVRKDKWKYGWNCSNVDELYDLAADPHETVNLIDDPDCLPQVTEMRTTLEEWMVETRYPGRTMYVQSRMNRQPWV
jgi:arylsulfatase A-like enzyme